MRLLLFVFLLLSVVLIVVPAHAQKIEPAPLAGSEPCTREVDEFTENVKYTCSQIDLEIEEQPGKQIFRASAYLMQLNDNPYLLLYTYSDSWNFLRTEIAYALFDGNRYEFALEEVARNVSSGRVSEQNAIRLTEDNLKTLSETESFRIKVGRAVFRVPMKDLREEADYLAGR